MAAKEYTLSTPGSIFGPIVEIPGGDYRLSLFCNALNAAFALQTISADGETWEDITLPPLLPGLRTIKVTLPAGLVRLDVRNWASADVFAVLRPCV